MADPITNIVIEGFITSSVPPAAAYPYPEAGKTGPVLPVIFAVISFRASAPTANVARVISETALSTGVSNQVINNGAFTTAYDATANTTTLTIQAGGSTVSMVVPQNLSGIANGYYTYKDTAGNVMFTAVESGGSLTGINFPNLSLGTGAVNPAANPTPTPPPYGSGSFTQVGNGLSLSGTFIPAAMFTYTIDASQDAYWSTH